MSAGSVRRNQSLRAVPLPSLSDELDELLHTTRRYDDPEPREDLEALPDDDDSCVSPLAQDPPAIPAESAPLSRRQEPMAITSNERVKYTRPVVTHGRPKKGQPVVVAQGKRGRLVVPADLADLIPEGTEFVVEISEQGIVFTPAAMVSDRRKANLPAWAKNGAAQ